MTPRSACEKALDRSCYQQREASAFLRRNVVLELVEFRNGHGQLLDTDLCQSRG
jgi:hypothetical protein